MKRLSHIKRRSLLAGFLSAGTALILASVTTSRAADEEGLLSLWKQHMTTPEDHEAVIKACRAFSSARASDPLSPVVRGIEAWHTLRDGRRQEAFAMWEADLGLPPSPLNDCARRLASGWLSRADREKVVSALQAYYRKEVAYPRDLAQISAHPRLKNEPKAPDTDRFGKPWSYALTGFQHVKGFPDQKYSLRSVVLGDLSDLKAAEKLPYGAKLLVTPQRVITMPDSTLAVSFSLGATSQLSLVGPGTGDLHLAFVGTKFLVVCDHTHWKILPRP